jgi:hypothetical protein
MSRAVPDTVPPAALTPNLGKAGLVRHCAWIKRDAPMNRVALPHRRGTGCIQAVLQGFRYSGAPFCT